MFEFILERYNYWIAIILMMTGLYIVFSRGNLVKKIIGLNIFQTSVFIYYISIGKVAGGTAPIFLDGHGADNDHAPAHGGGDAHATDTPATDTPATDAHGNEPHHADAHINAIDSADRHGSAVDHAAQAPQSLHQSSQAANVLFPQVPGSGGHSANEESLHTLEGDLAQLATQNVLDSDPLSAMNTTLAHDIGEGTNALATALTDDLVAHAGEEISARGGEAVEQVVTHTGAQGAEILYSNPLPHVLILTAIVVGVATTAVGLALAVRIREAYGTIEEDELEIADDIAEFGEAASFVNAPEGEAA